MNKSAMPTPQPKKYRAFPPAYFMPQYPARTGSAILQPYTYGMQPLDNITQSTNMRVSPANVPIAPSEINSLTLVDQHNAEVSQLPDSGRIAQTQAEQISSQEICSVRGTLLLWTQICVVLLFLASIVNVVHLWIWVHSNDYYFQHWQIVLVEVIPRTIYTSAFCALIMYCFVLSRWYLVLIRQLSMQFTIPIPRKKYEILPLFFPVINIWGLPQALTELLLIIRHHRQAVMQISHQLYIVAMRRIRIWSFSWIALWVMTFVEIIVNLLVQRADAIALNDEFRIIWLFLIGLHLCFTYKTCTMLTILVEFIMGIDRIDEKYTVQELEDTRPADIIDTI